MSDENAGAAEQFLQRLRNLPVAIQHPYITDEPSASVLLYEGGITVRLRSFEVNGAGNLRWS